MSTQWQEAPTTGSDRMSMNGAATAQGRPLGQLISQLTSDVSRLFRQEIQLARIELREEISKAIKGSIMLSIAALAGVMTLVFLSATAVFALGNVMEIEWAALIVAGAWLAIAAICGLVGTSRMKQVDPGLHETTQTLKEDVQWLKRQKH